MSNTWLKNIKVGDKVIVSNNRRRNVITNIERLTKTQVVLKGTNIKYRRADGNSVGNNDYFFGTWLCEATTEQINIIRQEDHRQQMLQSINTVNFEKLSVEDLEVVYDIVQSVTTGDKS